MIFFTITNAYEASPVALIELICYKNPVNSSIHLFSRFSFSTFYGSGIPGADTQRGTQPLSLWASLEEEDGT